MDLLKNIAWAVAEFFGWKRRKLEVDNSPAMQANAQARTDAAEAQRDTGDVQQAINGGDLDQLRKDAAE